jgi:C-terminal processing protease CtpA/Prc
MRFSILISIGAVLCVILVFGAWFQHSAQIQTTARPSLNGQEAMSYIVQEAKSRFQGGIGAVLTVDPSTGLPRVMSVLPGSPAALAELKPGDQISQVNGETIAGMPLPQAIELIRGFPGRLLELKIQRPGETNLVTVRIRRASWKSLGVPK